eukprot:CAMPEP_0198147394 /NCGR_PEP_ID=MMETSP1443-20131203/35336_1 /TAXON_ID=186043 /ORGANISM="Entomoneis sp., Strain CCMP2396" /LENGTH=543 /DNA_ID=CAMNT_0043811709 /DNA_START=77 /DNA_END=1705 /DNA_ORIENTATION=-
MSSLQGKEGVCRIEVSRVEWLVLQPWQRTQQKKSTGSGFVIDGERLITNAHVVKSAVDIRVRPHGSTRRYPAKVVVYAPDVDLALLEIKGDDEKADFFNSFQQKNNVKDAKTTNAAAANAASITSSEQGNGDGDAIGSGDEKRQRKSAALEFAEDLPALQESVHVVGFPTGGTTICVTEGVVSRIDLTPISAFNNMLAIQVDSAINPGNSGGPAFNSAGKVTGIAFLKKTTAARKVNKVDNIGYLIPATVVRAFLDRCAKTPFPSSYTLSPSIPYRRHSLENKSLRLAHSVPESIHGVLITSVCQTFEGILCEGDVLTKIDDKDVADDGQVILRGDHELIQHEALLLVKRVDETVVFSVYRNGQHITCSPKILQDIPSIIPRWMDVDFSPSYMILGALVLLPFSWPLRSESKCGLLLQADSVNWYRKWPHEWQDKKELVVLVDVFSHELSFSYVRPWRRVVSYNGIPIRSLSHLRDLWEASCENVRAAAVAKDSNNGDTNGGGNQHPEPTFARLGMENDDDVVFEVAAAMNAQSEILETHQIA